MRPAFLFATLVAVLVIGIAGYIFYRSMPPAPADPAGPASSTAP